MFEMSERILEKIAFAAAIFTTQKTPMLHLIIGEALRTSPNVHGYFMAKIWKAFGRISTVPMAQRESEIVSIHTKGDASDPANNRPKEFCRTVSRSLRIGSTPKLERRDSRIARVLKRKFSDVSIYEKRS